jgi:hypothetical protein
VIVVPEWRAVVVYSRDGADPWDSAEFHGAADVIEIPDTNAKISLADIFDGLAADTSATV